MFVLFYWLKLIERGDRENKKTPCFLCLVQGGRKEEEASIKENYHTHAQAVEHY